MANISENLSTVKQSLIDIKNAIIDKGITLTGNITTYADAIDQLCLCGGETVEGTELYIENMSDSDGVFQLNKGNSPTYKPNLIYRIGDNGEWFEYDMTTLPSITVPSGSKIYFRGNNANGFNLTVHDYYIFNFSKSFNIGGYITSLLALDNFNTVTDIPSGGLSFLFYGQINLLNAKDLITDNIINVGQYGFANCFQNCSILTTAPTFENVTTISGYGFAYCFQNCSSLTTTPTFDKITTVSHTGFAYCFQNCSSLTTTPTFDKITTVNTNGFDSCFKGCTKLQVIYAPNINTWISDNFENWVDGVATTGVLFKSEILEIPTGVNGIPEGWTTIIKN